MKIEEGRREEKRRREEEEEKRMIEISGCMYLLKDLSGFSICGF